MSMGRSSMGKQIAVTRSSRDGVTGKSDGMMPQPSAKPIAMKSGGKVGRGDGCCMKGKTKGRSV